MLDVGDMAPNFCLKNQDDETVCLEDFRGKWVILYFYPKDNTSGCTREAKDFSSYKERFEELNAVILGVSPDSTSSHRKFVEKHNLTIMLLSDPEHKVLEAYGAWGKKKRGKREYYGVIRSTFIIDPEGHVRAVWRNVRVKGHVETVYNKLKELQVQA